jgi:hypothetical protein
LNEVPLWEALDRLCQAAGLTFHVGSPGHGLTDAIKPREASPHTAYTGPLRLQVVSLTYSRHLPLQERVGAANEHLTVYFETLLEGRAPVVDGPWLRLLEARDEGGQSLGPGPRPIDVRMGFYQGHPAYQFGTGQFILRGPAKLGGKLKSLKGALLVDVAVERRPVLTVEKLAEAKGKTFDGEGGLRLALKQVPQGRGASFLQFTLTTGASAPSEEIELAVTDAEGRPYQGGSRLVAGGRQEGTMQFWPGPADLGPGGMMPRRPGPADLGPPAKLTVYRFKRIRAELPFAFHDLPLP